SRSGRGMKILVIEDTSKTSSYLRRGLEESGFTVQVATNGDDGLHLAREITSDLIILDVMLPGRDGWSVLRELRQAGRQTPVLFLTARDAVHYRLRPRSVPFLQGNPQRPARFITGLGSENLLWHFKRK